MPASSATRFGTLLREFRERAGLSQRTLAASLHVAPATISKIETGRIKLPRTPAFYERLLGVPGFTPANAALLQEAAEAGEFIARVDTAKANQERAILLAQLLTEQGKFAASGNKYVWDVIEYLKTIDADLPSELKPIGQALTQILTESPTMLSELLSVAIASAPTHTIEAPTATVEEEAPDILTKSVQTDTHKHDSISLPITFTEVRSSEHLIQHVSELQSHSKLGSERRERPTHYPHENVVFHVAQLRAEAQIQEEPPAGSGIIYERGRIMTLAGASRASGVKVGTLRNYLSDGKLTERGRIKASGGGKVLIDLDELNTVLSSRKPGGRPRKVPERMVNKRPRGRPRKTPESPTSSEHLKTLAEASEISGIPVGTLSSYIHEGKLTRQGRQRSPAPGGGKVLIDPDELASFLSSRRPRGRPKKNPATGNNS